MATDQLLAVSSFVHASVAAASELSVGRRSWKSGSVMLAALVALPAVYSVARRIGAPLVVVNNNPVAPSGADPRCCAWKV